MTSSGNTGQKLAALFPDKPFDKIIEVLGSADVGVG